MGKVKTFADVKKNKKEQVKKVATKRTKKRRVSWDSYVRKICKSLKVPIVSRDALPVISSALNEMSHKMVEYLENMLSNSNKMVTLNTTKLSFIGYLRSQNVNPDVVREALKAGQDAVSKFQENQ